MRITQQMKFNSSLHQMNKNLSRLQNTYNQVSSGKKLHRPSDDPIGVSKSLQLNQAIRANEQYERNTNEATLWLEESEQNINQMVQVMQRVRELAVRGSNDTATDDDREAIALEVTELKEQLRNFANAKVNGDYLFNGQKSSEAPFPNQDPLSSNIDTSAKLIAISDGVEIKVNVTVDELFGTKEDETNLFATLDQLIEGLKEGEELPLDAIDEGVERLLTTQAQIGARVNRVDSITNRRQDHQIELQSMLSKVEDVDFSEALIKFTNEQNVYQASLMVSSRIFQQSLMDFLR